MTGSFIGGLSKLRRRNNITIDNNSTNITIHIPMSPSRSAPRSPPPPRNRHRNRECNICYIRRPVITCPTCQILTCRNCLKKYLQNKIDEGEVYKFKCPNYECNRNISKKNIEQLMGKSKKELIKEKEEKDARSKPKCVCNSNLILKRKNNLYYYVCSNSKCHKLCLCCNSSIKYYHYYPLINRFLEHECPTETSREIRQKIQENTIKPCPKCNYLIEKINGCPHMKCSKCHTHFCWECRKTKRGYQTNGEHRCTDNAIVYLSKSIRRKLRIRTS